MTLPATALDVEEVVNGYLLDILYRSLQEYRRQRPIATAMEHDRLLNA